MKQHWSFWLIWIVGLLWNAGGATNYVLQTNPEIVSAMPASHQAIVIGRPAWATGGFAIGVFGGVIGCVLLMLLNRSALYVFLVSLVGIVVTVIHTLRLAVSGVEFGAAELFLIAAMPVLVAIGLLAYAKHALRKYSGD